jgi:LemA protein
MKSILVGVGVLVVAALVIVVPLMGSKNDLVREKNDIDGKWAQVDNDIKRRADLIPNLVATVQGYAKQEQSVITAVANARAALGGATSGDRAGEIKANDQLTGALSRLLVLQEAYPDLKSNQEFMKLQDQLEGTENRIAISRRDYNLAIQKYNTDVELFPKSLAAGIFGFKRDDAYFKTTDEEKKVPTVKF